MNDSTGQISTPGIQILSWRRREDVVLYGYHFAHALSADSGKNFAAYVDLVSYKHSNGSEHVLFERRVPARCRQRHARLVTMPTWPVVNNSLHGDWRIQDTGDTILIIDKYASLRL